MSNFNIETAKFLIDFAIDAYHDEENLSISSYGFKLVKFIDNKHTDTQGFIAKDENRIIIAFRGTSSLKDAITDISIVKVRYPKIPRWFFKPRIHKGFLHAYLSIKDEVLNILKEETKSKSFKIYCTGHSLGGALATIMALEIKKLLKIDPVLYTYGAPKVGNRWFVRHYNRRVKNSYRIVNDDDPVPQLPALSFTHVRNYVLIDDSKNIVINPRLIEIIEKSIEGIVHTLSGQSLKEHASKKYKELLDKI